MTIKALQRKLRQGAHIRYDGSGWTWTLWHAGQPTQIGADEFDALFYSGAIEHSANHEYADGMIWIAKPDGCSWVEPTDGPDPVADADLLCPEPIGGTS